MMLNWVAGKRGIFWYGGLACYLSVLVFLSLNPWVRPASTGSIFSPDKLEHVCAYALLTCILFYCLARSRNTAHAWLAAIITAVMIGILIEIAQTLFTSDRSGSVGDALANGGGAALGFLVYNTVKYTSGKLAARAGTAPESR